MDKKGGFFGNLLLILLLAVLGVSIYYLYQFWPREPVDLQTVHTDELVIVQNDVPSRQFYERMRYQTRLITYSIAGSCSPDRVSSMERAFADIESLTILDFEPSAE